MDNAMLNILKGFDNVEKKTLQESAIAECGMDEMGPASAPLSVNISGDAGDIASMLRMLSGMNEPTPKALTAIPMDDPEIPGRDDVPGDADMDDGKLGGVAGAALGGMVGGIPGAVAGGYLGHKTQQSADNTNPEEESMEDYDNEPEEEYMDVDDVLPSGDDMHRKKDMKAMRVKDPAVESIKDRLWAALNEKKSTCSECGKPSYTTLPEEKQKGVDGKVCWKGYKRMGTKMKGGKRVDNCVKM